MLSIRKEQLQIFHEKSVENFSDRTYDFLCEEFEDIGKENKSEVIDTIKQLIEKGNSYQLITEQQLIIFIITAWLLGKNFDTDFPKANEILSSSNYSPSDKVEWLSKWTESLFKALEE